MNLDWRNIRSLAGDKDKGFEEFCTQLARQHGPDNSKFIRNGTPDAGVECVVTTPQGMEWGWQSKYIFTLGKSQWAQLDESVRSALGGHPNLVRYYICIPIDLPDGRSGASTSARQNWSRHTDKWKNWGEEKGMNVEFILWDSAHMLLELARPQNSGLAMFWFGSPGCFTQEWFEAQITKAINSAGPRYTPEIHVELPISKCFDAFGRTDAMVERVEETGRELREKCRWLLRWDNFDDIPKLGDVARSFQADLNELFKSLDEFQERPFGTQGLYELRRLVELVIAGRQPIASYLKEVGESALQLPDKPDSAQQDRKRRLEKIDSKKRELWEITEVLYDAKASYEKEAKFAETQRLAIIGEAGTGKTHLLCDLAKERLLAGRPTILLLGQSFTTTEDPGRQVLSLLDLPNISLGDFVGCLEASAKAANSRGLILIDALNEGLGRQFWPQHLSGFIETVTKSPWLGVVVSVRTCYLESVIPEEVRASMVCTRHTGFEEIQYEAAKSFFMYHGLEFGSTPVFSREFSNPLFLKTLCKGLKDSGCVRLPRGFHGITKVFDLYIDATNKVLSARLNYPPKLCLVRQALQACALAMAERKLSWLPLSLGREAVDALLPNREYSQSLYKALLDEGILMEGLTWTQDGISEDTVCIAYERWADHLVARQLLDKYLDQNNPAGIFKPDGILTLRGEDTLLSAGLIEALSIQLPERIGRELLSLAPYAIDQWGVGDAFLNSVLWRDPRACTHAMKALMNYYEWSENYASNGVWNTRIAAATIPGHALNMEHSDRWLKATAMPDRDADWSISIHREWDQDQSIRHLIDWAGTLERGAILEDDAIWLSSLTLSWCFTSSNRMLRDRATKAAINLLDGRLEWVTKLVHHFADIDDLYVLERILAIALGTTLRSKDVPGIKGLAIATYETVFASGSPHPHILLRDYARGVIERASYLDCELPFDLDQCKPPYRSEWPNIPTDIEIKALEESWKEIGKSKPDEEWAKHSIISSVLDGDFGRYVIGTNSWNTNWLSIRLEEPDWKSPDERIEEFVNSLSDRQKTLWDEFSSSKQSHGFTSPSILESTWGRSLNEKQKEELKNEITDRLTKEAVAKQKFLSSLRNNKKAQIENLLVEQEKFGSRNPPSFDLRWIQRYVVKRVFDLGWTVERFGRFDRNYIKGSASRSPHKAERMGKKYQWIAYHEISAFVADHFKYFEQYGSEEGLRNYLGPWQGWFRNIDPTHNFKRLPLCGTRSKPLPEWWIPSPYSNWQNERTGADWALDISDLPDLSGLICLKDNSDVSWLNAFASFSWRRKHRPSETYDSVEDRSIWLKLHAFLVRDVDVSKLVEWGATCDSEHRWFDASIPRHTNLFLGEYAWSDAARFFECPYYADDGWSRPGKCPVEALSVPSSYLEESAGFDCSLEEGFQLYLPCSEIVRDCGLEWTGIGSDFADKGGRILAKDPSAHEYGDNCLLLRRPEFAEYLKSRGLSMVWAVTGRKYRSTPTHDHRDYFESSFSGVLVLKGADVEGQINFKQSGGGKLLNSLQLEVGQKI